MFVVQTEEDTCWHLASSDEALLYVPSHIKVFQETVGCHFIIVEKLQGFVIVTRVTGFTYLRAS